MKTRYEFECNEGSQREEIAVGGIQSHGKSGRGETNGRTRGGGRGWTQQKRTVRGRG